MKFTVRIIEQPVHRDVVVEAPDFNGAAALGEALANTSGAKIGFVRATEDSRLSTYTCLFCSAQTEKEHWGAGRVTCPKCGRFAPSPAELLCESCGAAPAHGEHWFNKLRFWCEAHMPMSGHYESCSQPPRSEDPCARLMARLKAHLS